MEEGGTTSPGRRRNMQAIHSRDTALELAVRSALHAHGLRYRVDLAPVPGFRRRADLVFARVKIAVFLDGCFWHGCPQHSRVVQQNGIYWNPKLARNKERDEETNLVLGEHGWTVLRYWEHEAVDEIVGDIEEQVRQARRGLFRSID